MKRLNEKDIRYKALQDENGVLASKASNLQHSVNKLMRVVEDYHKKGGISSLTMADIRAQLVKTNGKDITKG